MGDGPQYSTGYSVIIKNLAREFRRRGVEVGLMSMQTQGSPLAWKDPKDGYVYPLYAGSEVPVGMEKAFKDFSADLAVHVRDLFYGSAQHHSPAYRIAGVPCRPRTLIDYTPVQADMLPDGFVDVALNDCNFVVSMTEWGRDVMLFQGVPSNRLDYAHGGFDPEVYRPGGSRKEDYGFSPDKRLIVDVGIAGQPRKSFPTLIKAASIVKRKYDVELYLHTALAGMSADIPHFVNKYGMKGSVIVPEKSGTWGVDEEKMAGIYNAADVYCSPSSEEGFNMPLLEAFACGTPAVTTGHPNHKEILGDLAFYAEGHRIAPTAWSWGWWADPEELAVGILSKLGMDDLARADLRNAQLERAKGLTWERIAGQWFSIFERHKTEWGIALP